MIQTTMNILYLITMPLVARALVLTPFVGATNPTRPMVISSAVPPVHVPSVLTKLAQIFDQITKNNTDMANLPEPSIYNAVAVPSISIKDYLTRIRKYTFVSDEVLIAASCYVLKGKVSVTRYSVHRILSTAIMIAAKFHDDTFYSNKYYAAVFGVKLRELNKLEQWFLWNVDVALYVPKEQYNKLRQLILNYNPTVTG